MGLLKCLKLGLTSIHTDGFVWGVVMGIKFSKKEYLEKKREKRKHILAQYIFGYFSPCPSRRGELLNF
jgi:hypothetical protein